MSRYFPPQVRWTRPQGGLFLWVTLPEWLDAGDVFNTAVANKVAFVPGSSFDPEGSMHNTMRLNFSNAKPEQIELGIKRLGEVLAVAIESNQLSVISYQ
jgi:2-aminoadipate transaminase